MHITRREAIILAGEIGAPKVDYEQLRMGIEVELEHSSTIHKYARPEIPDLQIAASIAVDHLKEYPDYYTRLKKVETNIGPKL